eukprot:550796_1
MTNTMESVKAYQGFEEGMYASKNGRTCQIKKIHFEMHPPTVTVCMVDTQNDVGTEFDRLDQIQSWSCNMCTAHNDNSKHKCRFCQFNRTYKEQTWIKPKARI